VTPELARDLIGHGIDLQLHTHRHRFPAEPALLAREIADNRRVLAALGQPHAVHLCYPSGEWRADAFATLAGCEIASATTCIAGLNDTATEPLALRRLLDADDISSVEFEAEVSGFKELLRDTVRLVRGGGR
jgi:peptidoglycan/xylan/chitin deacetylase (PgdA/CDA1 family)